MASASFRSPDIGSLSSIHTSMRQCSVFESSRWAQVHAQHALTLGQILNIPQVAEKAEMWHQHSRG